MSDEHYENVRCDGCGKWASCCSCDEDRHSVIVNLLNPNEDSGPDQPALKAGASVHGSIGARRLADTTPEEHGLRGEIICCQKCGEVIRGLNLKWGSYKTLCGLCYDDCVNS